MRCFLFRQGEFFGSLHAIRPLHQPGGGAPWRVWSGCGLEEELGSTSQGDLKGALCVDSFSCLLSCWDQASEVESFTLIAQETPTSKVIKIYSSTCICCHCKFHNCIYKFKNKFAQTHRRTRTNVDTQTFRPRHVLLKCSSVFTVFRTYRTFINDLSG